MSAGPTRARRSTWRIGFVVGYGFIYLGWWFHRSAYPAVGPYSKQYLAFLAMMLVPFLLPASLSMARRRIGTRGIVFSLIPLFLLAPVVYFGFSLWYYHRQEHRFDPFAQMPVPRLETAALEPADKTEIRILALGGSTTECPSLNDPDRYPAVLERILRERFPDRKVVVFSAGKSWYTSRHSLINYASYYHRWRPDVVVILHGINDIVRAFEPETWSLGPYDPLYTHFYGPAVAGAKPPTFERYLYHEFLAKPMAWATSSWFSIFRTPRGNLPVDYPVSHYRSLKPFRENIQRLCELAQRDGATVAVVTQPMLYKESMSADEQGALLFARDFCAERRSGVNVEPSTESLRQAHAAFTAEAVEVANRTGATVIDAAAFVPRDLRHFEDDCHYTPQGAAKLAALVADGVEKILRNRIAVKVEP